MPFLPHIFMEVCPLHRFLFSLMRRIFAINNTLNKATSV